jgi:hypothetical protein
LAAQKTGGKGVLLSMDSSVKRTAETDRPLPMKLDADVNTDLETSQHYEL